MREEVERRKRRLGILSYDDLLSQLADALEDPAGAARVRMRQRWRIVLVDEFQDTDPVQWRVLDRAFTGHATMVLIGDPKQAIYAFRGGDVATYLQAAATAGTTQTLSVNWRSDAPLLDGVQRLLSGAALGDDRIVVHDVDAHHQGDRLVGAPVTSPFRLRVVRRDTFDKRGNAMLTVAQVRPHIARDLALDVRRLLAAKPTFAGEPLEPRHVAVISYRHADLAAARAALHELGVPAVIAGGGSVFATPAAVEWLTLLEALEQPHRSTRVRAAALTCFVGHTAAELDERGDDLTDDVADTLRTWLELFTSRGVAAVLEAATVGGLSARVLAEVGGERRLTDLRHIGEALHEVALTERPGVVSLLAWLREQVAEGRAGRGLERTRRLDSDAAAVQLVTIHASKGLEYPVVYLPAVGDRHVPDPSQPLFHDDAGRRCRNIGGGGAGWADHCQRWKDEEAGEWLRLLYVALTRAQSQVVCWWAPSKNAVASPLHRMLLRPRRCRGGAGRAAGAPATTRSSSASASGATGAGRPPRRRCTPTRAPSPSATAAPPLAVREFRRDVDVTWRRSSYSSLSRVEPSAATTAGGRGQRARDHRQGRRGPRRGRGGPRLRARARRRRPLPDGRAPGRRHLRLAGARGARAHRPRRPRPAAPSCSGTSTSSWAGGRSTSTVTSWPTRWSRSATPPSARWWGRACARSRCATGCARWSSSCRWPAATSAPMPPTSASATSGLCSSGTCPRATRSAATPPRWPGRWAGRACAATSPGRSTWCCGCATSRAGRAT